MKLSLWNYSHYSLRYQARTERHSRKFWSASDNKMRRPMDVLDYKQTRVCIAVKRSHDHGNSYKGKHVIGASLEFRGLVYYHHGWKHGGADQADMVLEMG